jgi:hypothetical protein
LEEDYSDGDNVGRVYAHGPWRFKVSCSSSWCCWRLDADDAAITTPFDGVRTSNGRGI